EDGFREDKGLSAEVLLQRALEARVRPLGEHARRDVCRRWKGNRRAEPGADFRDALHPTGHSRVRPTEDAYLVADRWQGPHRTRRQPRAGAGRATAGKLPRAGPKG